MRKFYAHIKLLPYQSVSSIQIVIGFYDFTKALKIEKMQSDFVANASHELKTPLSIISSVVETIQTSAKDDEQAREQFMEIIATQTEYMSQLIERLLSLSKIELLENEEPKEKVNLPDIVTSVKKSFAIKAKNNSMNIKTIKAKDIYPIKADEQQVKQIIQNLIDNAIKYGEKNTTITIRIYNVDKIPPSQVVNVANSKGVVFSINNKSAKIPSEKLARLTERFYRLQENENYKIKGTGLGLAIVKHIVIRHRGNITVNSNGNDGTTFMVYLPVFEGK
jgi:two-component system phosphate regulon sensor histidine kinase PhoR